MSEVVPFGGGGSLSRRDAKRAGNAVSRLSAATGLDLSRVDSVAVVQAAKVEAVTYVGRQALSQTALLTQMEQELAGLVPMASGRLQAIADLTTLDVISVVSETGRRLK